jgi:hypothetical protein
MRIIQISGKGRVGKSTLANFIAKYSFNLGYIPVILPFAQAIKDLAQQQGLTKESDSSKYREFCQELGASKRQEDEDYWVTRTFEKIQEYMVKEIDNKQDGKTHWEYVIIQDDVRYMNELALGRDLVATQIFLDSSNRKLEEKDADWRTHESETLANVVEESLGNINSEYEDLFDVIIDNGGSLVDLDTEARMNLPEWLEMGYLELEGYDEETK